MTGAEWGILVPAVAALLAAAAGWLKAAAASKSAAAAHQRINSLTINPPKS